MDGLSFDSSSNKGSLVSDGSLPSEIVVTVITFSIIRNRSSRETLIFCTSWHSLLIPLSHGIMIRLFLIPLLIKGSLVSDCFDSSSHIRRVSSILNWSDRHNILHHRRPKSRETPIFCTSWHSLLIPLLTRDHLCQTRLFHLELKWWTYYSPSSETEVLRNPDFNVLHDTLFWFLF